MDGMTQKSAGGSPLAALEPGSPGSGGGRARGARTGGLRAGRRRGQGVRTSWLTLASVVVLVLVWWGVSADVADPNILPSPSATASRAITLITSGGSASIWPQLEASTLRVLIGWALGAVIGIPIGVLMASSTHARAAIDPLLEAGRAVPPLAFAPLMVVWLGIGEISKIALLVTAAAPIIAISTTDGIVGLDNALIRGARTLGASRTYLLRHVIVPGALPGIITGLRLASGLTWGTLVAAEFIASTSGLGYMILQASQYLDTATIFVGIAAIGVLAFLMDRALRLVERRLLTWRGRA